MFDTPNNRRTVSLPNLAFGFGYAVAAVTILLAIAFIFVYIYLKVWNELS